jgi:hypothetical protein
MSDERRVTLVAFRFVFVLFSFLFHVFLFAFIVHTKYKFNGFKFDFLRNVTVKVTCFGI